MRNRILFYTFLLTVSALGFFSCRSLNPTNPYSSPIKHDLWDELLKAHVREDGLVDYQGFQRDNEKLQKYLTILQDSAPNNKWGESDQIAYWINAYNAFTVDLILRNYPLESIKDIGSSVQIPFVNSPWDIKFINIGGKKYDLNNIEHNILRKNFEEPRIHFAIVCASSSCPKLRTEAFTGERLDEQLTEQAREFLSDPSRNVLAQNKIQISRIFKWFGGDFEKKGSIQEFIDQYSDVDVNSGAQIEYLEYDWGINDLAKAKP